MNHELQENKYIIYDRPLRLSLKTMVKIIVWRILSMWYRVLLRLWHPRFITKMYTVSVCAIFRDEAMYLKEWIEFHKIIGVEHFYLYNNFSDDNYLEVLSPYIGSGIVTLKEWPFKQAQMEAYADCVKCYGKETNWIGFIDLDEFVVPIRHDNIRFTLERFRNRPSVIFQWKCFGASGLLKRDTTRLVIEDFTVCWKKATSIGKVFFNTGYDYWPESCQYMHERWARYKGLKLPSVNIFDEPAFWGFTRIKSKQLDVQINHYLLKSYQEYVEKKSKRGGGIHADMHDGSYFFYHESRCTDTDYQASKYIIKIKLAMRESWSC